MNTNVHNPSYRILSKLSLVKASDGSTTLKCIAYLTYIYLFTKMFRKTNIPSCEKNGLDKKKTQHTTIATQEFEARHTREVA